MGAKTLQNKIWVDLRLTPTLQDCQGYLDNFFVKYPGVRKYIDNTNRMVEQLLYAPTYIGLLRRFNLARYDQKAASASMRQAVNSRISAV